MPDDTGDSWNLTKSHFRSQTLLVFFVNEVFVFNTERKQRND